MKMKLSLVSSALVGIVFGILSNYSALLQGTWFNLVIWGVVGLLIGAFIEQNRFITWSGVLYGFFVTASFLISGFHGTPDKIPGFALLSLGLSIIGALCGWCLVFAGNWVKRKAI